MKAILICPGERRGIAHLAESVPLVNIPMFGQTLLEYWLDYLAAQKVSEVRILATDRPEQIQATVGEGARWGLRMEIVAELYELTAEQARERYRPVYEVAGSAQPMDVLIADHFPGASAALFTNYSGWFSALLSELTSRRQMDRMGVRELSPGIWVGRRASIATSARVEPPSWIGENVRIGAHARIGPNAILENRVVADHACEIAQSWIGPETFVGSLTRVEHSLAWGAKLINWQTSSCIAVPDAFLMCSLSRKNLPLSMRTATSRLGSFLHGKLRRPFEIFNVMRNKPAPSKRRSGPVLPREKLRG